MQKVLVTELENVFISLYDIPRHFEGLNKTLSTARLGLYWSAVSPKKW